MTENKAQHKKDKIFLRENPNRERTQGGGGECTIIYWLQDLQRFSARVLVLGSFLSRKKEVPLLARGEGPFILDLICIHAGGQYGRDPRTT